VEIDGTAHDSVAANVYDDRRSEFLASSGVRVIRFMNDDVIRNLQGVLESIRMELRKP
jgi:very-short-patch-repair endonuclease